MENKLVSIVITNWNRKDDLRECLDSLVNQTYSNLEIIVVDNHSVDGSVEMIRNYFPKVKLIVMPNSAYGACETFNIGCSTSRGDYIVFMDNDALLEKDWIQKAYLEFEKDDKLGAVAGRIYNYYTKKDWGFGVYGLDKSFSEKDFYTTVFVGCSAMIKKDIGEKVGFYPTDYFLYHNEFALGAQITNHGYNILYCPRCVCYHKITETQRFSKKSYYYGTRNWYWYIWQYYPLKLALKHTLIHFIKSSIAGIHYPYTYMKSTLCAAMRIPLIFRNRSPIKSEKLVPLAW